ncbi:MAG: hypothetical protein GWO20_18305, partial [Candidatus Korarchaeota archaeon]|nr:hypothetical protein [Candidatus Korarchaeota archaeon]NIW15321.1 hypothetical protein [Candidatus Thorarchaeota archaeon]
MEVRYVYNERGEKKAVIIPIEVWQGIKDKLEGKGKKKGVFSPSECRGIYKDLQIDPRKEARS